MMKVKLEVLALDRLFDSVKLPHSLKLHDSFEYKGSTEIVRIIHLNGFEAMTMEVSIPFIKRTSMFQAEPKKTAWIDYKDEWKRGDYSVKVLSKVPVTNDITDETYLKYCKFYKRNLLDYDLTFLNRDVRIKKYSIFFYRLFPVHIDESIRKRFNKIGFLELYTCNSKKEFNKTLKELYSMGGLIFGAIDTTTAKSQSEVIDFVDYNCESKTLKLHSKDFYNYCTYIN